MKEKILKILMVVALITCMVGLDLIFIGNQAIFALYEGENITLESYFQDNENKVNSKQAKISENKT